MVPDIDVVADVGDSDTAVARVRELEPDVLLLDLSMPRVGGLDVIRRLAREGSRTAIIVLTRYREEAFVRESLAAGATGYVLKQSPFSEVQRALEHARRGERYVDRRLASTLQPRDPLDSPQRVSERELDVLHRAALGHSNKEVADALGIAVKTVEVHKTQAMRKLALRDRRDLIRYAALRGWLQDQ